MNVQIWKVVFAAVAAFAIAVLISPSIISYLAKLKFGQSIRKQGPKGHQRKAGTPVMGGVIIQIAAIIAVLLIAGWEGSVGYAIVALLGFGIIGLLDDWLIVVARRSLGLKARYKLLLQIVVSLLVALFVLARSESLPQLLVPFTGKTIEVPIGLFLPLAVVVITGSANAINLTDGLDGLAAGTTAIAYTAYALLCLGLPVAQPDLAAFAGAVAGACVGFTWFNSHPAQVFMGDTGSLALGGALGALAVLTHTELFLLLIGGVFVVETLSVMLQVTFFRLTGGKRIFRMSPLHHHFELAGWAEPKIVTRFWILALGFAILGLAGLVAFS